MTECLGARFYGCNQKRKTADTVRPTKIRVGISRTADTVRPKINLVSRVYGKQPAPLLGRRHGCAMFPEHIDYVLVLVLCSDREGCGL